jgi:putative hemolysin
VLGIVQAKDLLNAFMQGQEPAIKELIRTAPVIPDSVDARDVLLILKRSPVHIGLVYDEYGHFEGVVTTADILEAIVGTFYTEEGPAEPAVVRREDGSLLVSGWMPVDEFGDLTGIPIPESRAYETVAGFVLEQFGGLPGPGEKFTCQGWQFEVMDLDGRRIDKVLVQNAAPPRRARV